MLRAKIKASSTYIRARRSIQFPASSIIPRLMVQENAGVSLEEGSISSHFNISTKFLCFISRSGLLAKTFMTASMARLNASHFEADAVKPNTIAVARLYNLSALKPKAPVKSAWIFGNWKHALTSAGSRRIVEVG
jgi:hypothetical protein